MCRNTLLHDLVDSERDIALGEAKLANQHARLAEFDRDGQDRWASLDALAELKATQEAHERRRELILRALSESVSARWAELPSDLCWCRPARRLS
jgi:hypothetical protein